MLEITDRLFFGGIDSVQNFLFVFEKKILNIETLFSKTGGVKDRLLEDGTFLFLTIWNNLY